MISRRHLLQLLQSVAVATAGSALPLPNDPGPVELPQDNATETLCKQSATTLLSHMRAKKLSPVELIDASIDRIERLNPLVNAFVRTRFEYARQQAKIAEARYMHGTARPLEGLPLATKDAFEFVAGVPSTHGCRVLKRLNYTLPFTSGQLQRLFGAGAIHIGVTNAPEFAFKGVTDNYAYGVTRTPFDLTKNAGGSSGGAAAAVAASLTPLATGGDAGGSVRIPAAFCGVVGFKPTFGRIPEAEGPLAFLSHTPFLHPGPLTRTVDDAALMMQFMAAPDTRNPFSLPDRLDFRQLPSVAGKRIAYSPDLGSYPIAQTVRTVLDRAVQDLVHSGLSVEPVTPQLPDQREMSDLWNLQMAVLNASSVMDFFAWNDHIDLDAYKDELDPAFLATLTPADGLSARAFRNADFLQRARILSGIEDVLATHDFLITPTVGIVSIPNRDDGSTTGPTSVNGVAVDPGIGWALTHPINQTGHPAISIPAGFTEHGFPIGMQIIGRRWQDREVLALARLFEQIRPWEGRYPATGVKKP